MKGTKTEVSPGVWRLRVYAGRRANGTPIQITKTIRINTKGTPKRGTGVRRADEELAKMVADVSRGDIAAGTETVNLLLDRWLEHCVLQGRSPTTMYEYRRIADTVVRPVLGTVRLSKLREGHLDRLYADLTARGLKPASVRRVHALMSASLRYAERKKLVLRSVARTADPPPVGSAPVTTPSPGEVKARRHAVQAPFAHAFRSEYQLSGTL
ncbi:MAG: hypothetical protein ACRD1G_11525 [Acidimicrobiales bacterium]